MTGQRNRLAIYARLPSYAIVGLVESFQGMSGWPLESNGRPYSGLARGGAAGESATLTVSILGLTITVSSFSVGLPT